MHLCPAKHTCIMQFKVKKHDCSKQMRLSKKASIIHSKSINGIFFKKQIVLSIYFFPRKLKEEITNEKIKSGGSLAMDTRIMVLVDLLIQNKAIPLKTNCPYHCYLTFNR